MKETVSEKVIQVGEVTSYFRFCSLVVSVMYEHTTMIECFLIFFHNCYGFLVY